MSYTSFSNSANNQDIFHSHHQISTQKNHDADSSQLIFEENENETETENDYASQAFVISFLISFNHVSPVHVKHYSTFSLSEKLANPIYLSVCNFRI
ncbi:MAG: hypothetical protein JNJ41_12785 [Bacteroidia bacterium]|nr:hypothetical protein [Bacteroidia bacterium]